MIYFYFINPYIVIPDTCMIFTLISNLCLDIDNLRSRYLQAKINYSYLVRKANVEKWRERE